MLRNFKEKLKLKRKYEIHFLLIYIFFKLHDLFFLRDM